ncbi:hypothetical protein GH714_027983 [Hevea brasiliensis]|uniref:DUF7870 domain-containing protein n=1 Tax=Hevea brasiliensis TaxID=3981 RepID=A0A6A6N5D0_HEVBR|nr:hypothetical protein GH714_027983 [Hevea brasiliensis]
MEFARGYRAKEQNKMKHSLDGGIDLNSDSILVIKLPDSQVLQDLDSYLIDVEFLDSLLLDLADEGLIEKGDKALFVSSGIGAVIDNSRFLNANEIDLVLGSDLGQPLFHDASFDFVFAFGIEDIGFLDRIVKVGGVLVTQLSDLPNALQKKSNYKVVYLRRYSSTIVAMRKTSLANELVDFSSRRQLCELGLEAKKTSLDGLEDVLLEPPTKVLATSRKFLKKFNYLPDLLGDSLEDYPRRVFVDVSLQEEKDSVMTWFNESYPTRNREFEIYNIEEGVSKAVAPSDVSNWLMNVRQDEFVVMKAEAEVVEELIRRRTIGLVDELFLECKNQWQNGEGKRARGLIGSVWLWEKGWSSRISSWGFGDQGINVGNLIFGNALGCNAGLGANSCFWGARVGFGGSVGTKKVSGGKPVEVGGNTGGLKGTKNVGGAGIGGIIGVNANPGGGGGVVVVMLLEVVAIWVVWKLGLVAEEAI